MANYDKHPSLFQEEYCDQLIKHMSEGFSYETFSVKAGVCRATLYNWEEQHPEWLDAKKKAMEVSQYWWEKAGINGLYSITEIGSGGEKTVIEKKINAAMWIFNMKARFRWQDEIPRGREVLPEGPIEVLKLEDKKKLLAQGKQELKRLEKEIEKEELSE